MTESEYFGTAFARESRKLSEALDQRARDIEVQLLRPLPEEVVLAEEPEQIVDRLLAQKGGAPDPVGDPTRFVVSPGSLQQRVAREAELRGTDFEERIGCWRWELPFDWLGAVDLFGRWPDETDPDLEVFDNHPQLGTPPTIKWRRPDGRLIADCYTRRTVNTDDEAARESAWEREQTTRPDELFDTAIRYAKSYCDAANAQIDAWARRIREKMIDVISRRRRLLERGDEDLRRADRQLAEWRVPALELVVPNEPAEGPVETPARLRKATDLRPVLSDASCEAIVLVTNRWIDAVEKYSAAFSHLEEERVADLLTATLNGAFARADREVFIGGGKSDFYVTSQTLGTDGLPDAFAGELKNWTGPQSLIDAVGQSLNNLTQRTHNAVLVVLVKNRKSFSDAVEKGALTIAEDSRTLERLDDVARRPMFRLRSSIDTAADVRLSVCFVDLTRPEELQPKQKGRRGIRRGRVPK